MTGSCLSFPFPMDPFSALVEETWYRSRSNWKEGLLPFLLHGTCSAVVSNSLCLGLGWVVMVDLEFIRAMSVAVTGLTLWAMP